MSEELKRQGFVDAILQEPDVEDHRLVFADWLEDQGCSEEAAKYRELPGTAAVWCGDWGRDEYGLWCNLAIGDVRQCLRWIPPGSFWMGSPVEEEGRAKNEGPRHQVEISRGFWMFDAPCTQELWETVMGSNPSSFRGPKHPVESVSWEDCQAFLEKINSPVRGLELQLPTEAQWEYACRAGTEGERYAEDIDEIAWYWANSEEKTHPVKEKKPNGWGLYDMLGNVREWCRDGRRTYTQAGITDPMGPMEPDVLRAFRGGSWNNNAFEVRAARTVGCDQRFRGYGQGFRCLSLQ